MMIFAAAAALGGLVSCDKDRTPQNGDDSNQNGGDGNGTELTFEVAEAGGYFYGVGADGNGNALDFDMYLLSLQTEGVEMIESGYTGVGAAVLVDMNTPTNGGNPMRILQGEYDVYKNGMPEDYCFYMGDTDADGNISPSYVYYRESSKVKGAYYPVTGGSISVKTSGAAYDIAATFESSAGTFVFNYNGQLAFYDISDSDGDSAKYTYPENGGTPGNRSTYKKISFTNYNLGYQVYWGHYQDGNGKDITGYTNWNIELFDSYETNSFLRLEINTKEDESEYVTAGKYEFKEESPGDFTTELSLVPGALIAGVDSDYGMYGSWFFDIDNPIDDAGTFYAYRVTDGTVDVTINSDKSYTISYNLFDDYEGYTLDGVSNVAQLEYINGLEDDEESVSHSSAKFSLFSGKLKNAIYPKIRRVSGKETRTAKVPAFIKAQKRGR